MPHAPYWTDYGPGWVDYGAGGVRAIALPGLPPLGPPGPAGEAPPLEVSRLVAELEAYFAGTALFLATSPLVERAGSTVLRRRIYRRVSTIAPGTTMTYAEVAAAVGRPGAARAVGAAMAANPFAPVIPCHRVVGADGGLRGYGGGLPMKRALLAMEAGQREMAHV